MEELRPTTGLEASEEEEYADQSEVKTSSASGNVGSMSSALVLSSQQQRRSPAPPKTFAACMPLDGALSAGYRKLGMLVEHLETRICEREATRGHARVGAEWVLKEIDKFSQGLGKWLKVAGDDKAEILRNSIYSRPMTEFKTMVEFGAFVGYTATRMGRAVEVQYAKGYADGTILFEDSRLQGCNRITTMEIDPIHACIARHTIDISRLSHIVECWIGQVKDLIPRLGEEFGRHNLNMVFMDQRGTTFHDDLSQLEELRLLTPMCRLVADNTVKPGSPVYNWHTTTCECYDTTNYTLHEFLESTIEDWQVVCDFMHPPVKKWRPLPWQPQELPDAETWESAGC